ncbi:MAG: hypothetical protein IT458_04795 [Planctomycetes bacterium]|nr:hypothetical protein [Planctomycetota bacterium]
MPSGRLALLVALSAFLPQGGGRTAPPVPAHRADIGVPPAVAFAHLRDQHAEARAARLQGRAPRTLRRPGGAGATLAVVFACADAARDLPALLHVPAEDLVVMTSPGPTLRREEIAHLERLATEDRVSLAVVLVHEPCRSLASAGPASRPAAGPTRDRHGPEIRHALAQVQAAYLASPRLRALEEAGEFAVAVGSVRGPIGAIEWLSLSAPPAPPFPR